MNETHIKSLVHQNQFLREQVAKDQIRFEEKIAELSMLGELGQVFQHVTNFSETCRYLVDIIINRTVAQNCSFMLGDATCRKLYLICATDPHRRPYAASGRDVLTRRNLNYRLNLDEGVAGQVWHERRAILVPDTHGSQFFTAQPQEQIEIGSMLCVPLLDQGKTIGVINLSHSEPDTFAESEIHLFNIIANFVSVALNSALNYERLQLSEAKYRLLTENAADGIAIIQDGVHFFTNPQYRQMTGLEEAELAETQFDRLCRPLPDPTPATASRRSSETKAAAAATHVYEAVLKHSTRPGSPVEVHRLPLTYLGRPAMLVTVRDQTERKQLERQLHRAQKIEAIGTLASGVAHDFNNLLMGIQGRASLLLNEGALNRALQEHVRGIEDHVKSAVNLTNQLLGFAKPQSENVGLFDINALVAKTVEMFGRTRKEITLRCNPAAELKGVRLDQGRLEQVLLNLLVNSWHAMPDGGALTVETRNLVLAEKETAPYKVKPGRYVKISVCDSGIGIPLAIQKKIFDPFFTTKGQGRGTGLGLASAYEIVQSYGGFINFSSVVGEGSTFNVFLPAFPIAKPQERMPVPDLVKGSGKVLLVDDEEMIIDVGQQMLVRLGYDVVIARNGHEALAHYRQIGEQVAVVVMDMIMPGMSGTELYDNLKKVNPAVKVILSSGYSQSARTEALLKRGCLGFIQKPFNMETLSQKLHEVLHA